ncbi:MATE family efflux transporter [Dasania marina]|uniref:lipopolysaccharide biosynthesis protein n=1 Tax=Dasania marina TaxID=471499 RepID=UPI0030DB4B8F
MNGKIFKYTSINITIFDQCMVSGVSFILNILLARALGVEGFGVFSLLWVVVLFVSSVQLALIIYPMLTLAPLQEDRSAYLSTLLCFQLIFSFFAGVFTYVGVNMFSAYSQNESLMIYAFPLAVAIIFHTVQDFLRRVFFLCELAKLALLSDVLSYGGRVLLVFYLYTLNSLPLEGVLYATAICSFISVAVTIRYANFSGFNASQMIDFFNVNWSFSKWLLGSSLLQWFTGNLFVVAASSLLGVAAAGVVRVCQNLMGPVHVLFLAMDNFVPAKAAECLRSPEKGALSLYFRKLFIIVFGFILIVVIVVSSFSGFWLDFFYGSDYTDYSFLLRIYVLLYFLVAINTVLKLLLRTLKLTKMIFIADVIAALVALSVAFPLIKSYGLTGVVIGSALSLLIASSILFLGCRINYLGKKS